MAAANPEKTRDNLVKSLHGMFSAFQDICCFTTGQSIVKRIMGSKINLGAFRRKVTKTKKELNRFLRKIEKLPPRGLDKIAIQADLEVWQETDCLACANCCKTMSPTYTGKDVKRISAFLKMRPSEFRKKWLRKDKTGDWMNKTEPCQFLNLENNYCSIYEVRPRDCAGFPHHTKRHTSQYIHVFQQNIEYCPATYRLVEKMMEKTGARPAPVLPQIKNTSLNNSKTGSLPG